MVSFRHLVLAWSVLLGVGMTPWALVAAEETTMTTNNIHNKNNHVNGPLLGDASHHATVAEDTNRQAQGKSLPVDLLLSDDQKRSLQDSILESIPGYATTPSPTSAPRPDDFSEFNELLRSTVISLPDTDIAESLLFQILEISLRNLECSQLSFEDVRIGSDMRSESEVGLTANIVNLGLQCEFDFDWAYIFLTGNGHAVVRVADSSAQFGLDFYSPDFAILPPESASVTSCTTNINILGIEFSGNIASEIFNLFESVILGVLDGLLNEKICVELNNIGSEGLGQGLAALSELIAPYLEPVEAWRYNISYPEMNMAIPEDAELISWNDDTGFGDFMNAALDELDEALTSLREDPTAPNGTLTFPNGTIYPDGYDLGINVLLREYLLNENGVFALDIDTFGDSAVLLNQHDMITNTNISLISLKAFGLDTFTDLQPFQRYGNHTLQNVLRWEYLSLEVVIRMEIEASSLPDSIIRDAERLEPYVEEMKITIGLENIETAIAIMVALDPALMYSMKVGSVLEVARMVPCVLANLHDVALAGLNVTIGDILVPTVEGLVSPGLDRVIVDASEIGFFMFKGTVLQMLPSLFQSTIRDLVTDFLESSKCPPFELFDEDSFIDVRDLLLTGGGALEVGATGDAPYGDLASTIYGIGQSLWQAVEPDGTLGLNDLLVGPITEAISGQAGMISVPGELFNFTTNEENQAEFKTLVDRFEFALFDLRIENLDTIMDPLEIIQPTSHPYVTESTINIGPYDGAPLNVTIGLLMALDIADSPLDQLEQRNVITMGFSVDSVQVDLDMLTMISTNDFFNYVLQSGWSSNCWFASLPAPELDEKGYRVKGAEQRGMEVRRLLTKVSGLKFSIDCVECNRGLDSLPDMVDIFDISKVTDVLSYRIPLVLEEFATSETMQIHFDRWLANAPYSCKHRSEYQKRDHSISDAWETPEFSQLSAETSDTIFFTSIVAAQLGLVLLVETHYPWELDTLEPMSGQDNFVAPEGTDIIDFTNLTESFDNMANDLREYLGGTRIDESTGEEDLGINMLVRDILTDDDGYVDFVSLIGDEPIDFVIEGVAVMIHSIKVRGLDSFTRFDIFKPIAPQTVLNSVHMNELDVDMVWSMGARVEPQHKVTASLKFRDLNGTVPLFAAFDMNFLKTLDLGHFLQFDNIFPCFMAAAVDIHFPQILGSIGEILLPTFTGFLEDSQEALDTSMGEVYERYAERALKAIPIMTDVTARTFVNTFIADFTARSNCTHLRDWTFNNTPPGEEVHPFTGYVDFRELFLIEANSTALGGKGRTTYGDTIRSLTVPINNELLATDPNTGLSNANGIIGALSGFLYDEEGSIIYPGDLYVSDPVDFGIGALSLNASFSIGDLTIENIDTLGDPLQVLMPVFMEPNFIDNSFGLGLDGRPIRVSLRVTVYVVTFEEDEFGTIIERLNDVKNDMIISLELHSIKALFNVLVMISEERLLNFPVRDIFNPYCWAAMIPAPKLDKRGVRVGEKPFVSLQDIALTVAKLNLTIDCIECTSTGLVDLTQALAKPESSEALTRLAEEFVDFGLDIITGNLIQDEIDRGLNDAAKRCPHDPKYDPAYEGTSYDLLSFDRSVTPGNFLFLLLGIVGVLVLATVVIGFVVQTIVKRRHAHWLRTLPIQKVHCLEHQQNADKEMEKALNENTTAMISTPEVPKGVRYGMPLIILGNVAFFISGHASIAASILLEINIAGDPYTLDRVFDFTVVDTVSDMWEAGAKFMSIFILVFAIIWPYTKQFISLACWFLSPGRLSISTRGSTYLWLDTLAKWSMVDIFVLLITMVSFRVEAVTPDVPYLPKDFFILNIRIVPKWGLYANLIAQTISQVSSHYIIHYHRQVVQVATKKYEEEHNVRKPKTPTVLSAEDTDELSGGDDTKESSEASDKDERNRLCDATFWRPHKGEHSRLVTRQMGSYGLVVVTFLCLLLIIIGSSLPSFAAEIHGLISFVSMAGAGVYNAFNIFDIAASLVHDAVAMGGFKYVAGYTLLGAVLILTVFIVPILQTLALANHWFKPMNKKERIRSAVAIEVLAAWQYSEVFILAIFVSVLQLGGTSQTIIAYQCAEFEYYFEMLSYYGILLAKDSHCFLAEASIKEGMYLMFFGALLLALLNSFVMKASFQYFYDIAAVRKEQAMEGHLTHEEALSPVDDHFYKKITPPPVLFTDTFRWLLREEHRGDRPLQGRIVVDESHKMLEDEEDENISSASSSVTSTFIDVHEVDGVTVVDC